MYNGTPTRHARAASRKPAAARVKRPDLPRHFRVPLYPFIPALGVLARTIPQLNVFVVGFPVNVGVGLMALGVSLPFTVRLLGVRFAALEPTLATLVQRLAHG